MAIQTTDAPFNLQPNVAAGLAWIFGLLGGLIMLFGGGTNRFVKWAAAQSITFWGGYFVLDIGLSMIGLMLHLWLALIPVFMLLRLVALVVWIYTSLMAFQGKDIRLPVVAGLAQSLFAAQLV